MPSPRPRTAVPPCWARSWGTRSVPPSWAPSSPLVGTGGRWLLLLWLNNLAEEEVTTTVRFPDLAVTAARLATVFEADRSDLVVRDGSVVVRLKPGETRALAVAGALKREEQI